MKRLYRVTVEFEFVAYADDEYEAEGFTREAARDFYLDSTYAQATEMTGPLPVDWTEADCVYHDGEGDISVAEARRRIAAAEAAIAPSAEELEAAGQQRLIA